MTLVQLQLNLQHILYNITFANQ